MTKSMRVLTVKEFLECGETSKKLVVTCHRNGELCCRHTGPVTNLKLSQEEHYQKLSWSDSEGDPSIAVTSLSQKISQCPDWSEDEYKHTVYMRRK